MNLLQTLDPEAISSAGSAAGALIAAVGAVTAAASTGMWSQTADPPLPTMTMHPRLLQAFLQKLPDPRYLSIGANVEMTLVHPRWLLDGTSPLNTHWRLQAHRQLQAWQMPSVAPLLVCIKSAQGPSSMMYAKPTLMYPLFQALQPLLAWQMLCVAPSLACGLAQISFGRRSAETSARRGRRRRMLLKPLPTLPTSQDYN